jgi:hypothetical protein
LFIIQTTFLIIYPLFSLISFKKQKKDRSHFSWFCYSSILIEKNICHSCATRDIMTQSQYIITSWWIYMLLFSSYILLLRIWSTEWTITNCFSSIMMHYLKRILSSFCFFIILRTNYMKSVQQKSFQNPWITVSYYEPLSYINAFKVSHL